MELPDSSQPEHDASADAGDGIECDELDSSSMALLDRFARGDDSALGELVERESPRILRRVDARLPADVKRRIGASDILQQTAIDLIRVRERFQNQGIHAFRKMLSTMADFIVARAVEKERTQKRDTKKEAHVDPLKSGDNPLGRIAADQTTPSRILVRNENQGELESCFEQLPESDRQLILLVDYKGFSYTQIAERMNLPEDTLRKRHSRAIDKLRKLMGNPSD